MSYAVLGREFYGWLGGSTGGSPVIYHYGYPAFGGLEPNVSAQWLFAEGSGNIVDQVAAITVTKVGTPTYSVSASGSFSGLSPGITFGAGNYFKTAGDDVALDIGTNDFTFEFWGKTSSSSDQLIYDGTAAGVLGMWIDIETSGTFAYSAHFEAEDTTTVNVHIGLAAGFADGNIHKMRWKGIRTGNVEVIMDGVSQGTASIAALSGKTILNHGKGIGVWNAGNNINWLGTMYEMRLSLNSSNNSGGPSGG